MSEAERKRLRRRKKVSRGIKRTIRGIVLAPARMPRLTGDKVDRIMNLCEVAAIVFVAVLICHMALPETIGTFVVVAVGMIFAGLMLLIGLADYQDKLVEYELYGFKI